MNIAFTDIISGYNVLNHFIKDLADGMRALGHTVFTPTTQEEIRALIGTHIDVIIAFNVSFPDHLFLADEDTIFFSFLVDAPYYHHHRLLKPIPNHYISAVDQNVITYIQRYYHQQKKATFIPHGGSKADIPYIPFEKRAHQVSFFGSYTHAYDLFEQMDQSLTPMIKKIAFHTVDAFLAQDKLSIDHVLALVMQDYGLSISDDDFSSTMPELTCIDKLARGIYREDVINTLLANDIKVSIFGSGWEKFESTHAHNISYYSNISYAQVLETMANSQFVLNILPTFKNGSHERVFSSMLNRAVCITNKNTYFDSQFSHMESAVFYTRAEQDLLPNQILTLLAHPKRAEEIAQAGYTLCEKAHTWKHRAEEILSFITH